MPRIGLTTLFVFAVLSVHAAADDDSANCRCDSEYSTLQLYYPPEIAIVNNSTLRFKPEVAKIYVDDAYVGDAIVNVYGNNPTLRFPRGTKRLRLEMSEGRRFQTEITFLGNGSTQILYVDFKKTDQVESAADDNADARKVK